jgi:hypothetical protein
MTSSHGTSDGFQSPSTAVPPVIEVTRIGVQLRFRCPWCRCWHYHGAHGSCYGCGCELHRNLHASRVPCTCPIGAGNGHRHAHCTSERSPWRRTGYYLREVEPGAVSGAGEALTVLIDGDRR